MAVHATEKLCESEARLLALRIAADLGGEATTTQIKELVPKYRELTPEDLEPSTTRPNEQKWQQIMGNATGSHQPSSTSIFTNGYAEKTDDGIRLTKKGYAHLKTSGF